MSEQNNRMIREGYDAVNRGDVEWLRAHADPGLQFRSRFSGLSGRTYTGERAFEQWYADISESWEGIEQSIERLVELDEERTVVEVRFTARGRGSGIEVDQKMAVIFTVRNGKAVRMEAYDSVDEALAEAD
jgi:ketosteroid isomerase-like protein